MDAESRSDHNGLSNISRDSGDVAQYYDDWAQEYDETLAQWQYEAPREVAKMLRAELPPESVILDAGCGTGLSGRTLRDAGFETIDGIDVSARSLEIARGTGAYRNLSAVDMQQLPLPVEENQYDGLACVGVLTYLPNSRATLREFCRVVRGGGTIVVTQRSDLFDERGFREVLTELENSGDIDRLSISEPRPYLPDNDEFGDRILVRYIAMTVL